MTNYICKNKQTGEIVRAQYSLWSTKPDGNGDFIDHYGFRVYSKEDKEIEEFLVDPQCQFYDKYDIVRSSEYKLYYIFRESKGSVLSTTAGDFFGEGNFCGYYANSGFKNCHIIADYDGTDTIHKEVVRTVEDLYTNPITIIAKNDDEAFELFEKYKGVWE